MDEPRDETFPRSARLLRPSEYRRVQTDGKAHDLGPLVVRVAPRSGEPRLGLVVSKRVGNAVVRNSVKRRVRETFRKRRSRLFELEFVVNARPGAAGLAITEVERLFDALLMKLGR